MVDEVEEDATENDLQWVADDTLPLLREDEEEEVEEEEEDDDEEVLEGSARNTRLSLYPCILENIFCLASNSAVAADSASSPDDLL